MIILKQQAGGYELHDLHEQPPTGCIDDYNTLKPHEALDYATSGQVYEASILEAM